MLLILVLVLRQCLRLLKSILDHELLFGLWRNIHEICWFLVANLGLLLCLARILPAWRVGEWSGAEVIEGSLATEIIGAQLWLPQLLKFELPFELFSFDFKFSYVLGELAVLKRSTKTLKDKLSCLTETRYVVDFFAEILFSLSVVLFQFWSQGSRQMSLFRFVLHEHASESWFHIAFDVMSFSLHFSHLRFDILHASFDYIWV